MRIALYGNPSQSYGASLAIWDHIVLPATRRKWTCPALTPTSEAGTRFTYCGRMEGWVDLDSLIAASPGIEPTTAWSQVPRPNPLRHQATQWSRRFFQAGRHSVGGETEQFPRSKSPQKYNCLLLVARHTKNLITLTYNFLSNTQTYKQMSKMRQKHNPMRKGKITQCLTAIMWCQQK